MLSSLRWAFTGKCECTLALSKTSKLPLGVTFNISSLSSSSCGTVSTLVMPPSSVVRPRFTFSPASPYLECSPACYKQKPWILIPYTSSPLWGNCRVRYSICFHRSRPSMEHHERVSINDPPQLTLVFCFEIDSWGAHAHNGSPPCPGVEPGFSGCEPSIQPLSYLMAIPETWDDHRIAGKWDSSVVSALGSGSNYIAWSLGFHSMRSSHNFWALSLQQASGLNVWKTPRG